MLNDSINNYKTKLVIKDAAKCLKYIYHKHLFCDTLGYHKDFAYFNYPKCMEDISIVNLLTILIVIGLEYSIVNLLLIVSILYRVLLVFKEIRSYNSEYRWCQICSCKCQINRVIWIGKLLVDLHMKQNEPTKILVDNQVTIPISNYHNFNGKTKHFMIKVYHL